MWVRFWLLVLFLRYWVLVGSCVDDSWLGCCWVWGFCWIYWYWWWVWCFLVWGCSVWEWFCILGCVGFGLFLDGVDVWLVVGSCWCDGVGWESWGYVVFGLFGWNEWYYWVIVVGYKFVWGWLVVCFLVWCWVGFDGWWCVVGLNW